MAKPTVYFASFFENVLETLKECRPDVRFVKLTTIEREFVTEFEENEAVVDEIEILFADVYVLKRYMKKLKNLKWAHTVWNGVDEIANSVADAQEVQFMLTKQPGELNADFITEYVLAYILNIEKGVFRCKAFQEKAEYNQMECVQRRPLSDVTVGILGVGAIGKRLAKTCKAFNMTIWGLTRREHTVENRCQHVDEYRTRGDLADVLRNSDYVVNLLPSTPQTRHFLSGDVLQACSEKKGVLINVGRGDVIDEESIVRGIKNKWIGGAVLDTFETEPLPESSSLWSLPGVIVTPHVSGWSLAAAHMERTLKFFLQNLQLYLDGKPLQNVFNWEQGY